MPYSYKQVHEAAKGRWREILLTIGFSQQHLNGKAQPCPHCSTGDGNRFNFTDFKKTEQQDGEIGWSYCRGCGDGSGWHWLEKMTGKKGQDAWEYVAKIIGVPELSSQGSSLATEKLKSKVIIPVPQEAMDCIDGAEKTILYYNNNKESKYKNREYSRKFEYLVPYSNEKAEMIGLASRFKLKNGDKMTPMLAWHKFDNGDFGWSPYSFPEPKPLFGLNSIMEKTKPVYVVEGEKCQYRLARLIGQNVITWTCGAKSWKAHNWQPVINCDLIFIPDLDLREKIPKGKLGYEVMFEIAEHLGKPFKAIILDNPSSRHGHDIADAIGEGMTKKEFEQLKPKVYKAIDDKELQKTSVRKGERVKRHIPEKIVIEDVEKVNHHEKDIKFKPLGYDADKYYFYSKEFRSVRCFSRNGFTPNTLLELNSDYTYWQSRYPSKNQSGIDTLRVNSALIKACTARGAFNYDQVRRRGVFTDEGRVIVNLGDKIFVDGKLTDPLTIESEFIYTNGPAINIDLNDIASDHEGAQYRQCLEQLNLAYPSEAYLLAGWVMLSAISASLNYRPNLWLNAAMGSGKSWVINNLVIPILGPFAIKPLGGTTEAGLRHFLQGDCLPIIFDESEGNSDLSKQRMESILDLMRNYTYDSEFHVIKGSKDSKAETFTLKSMFFFSSISLIVSNAADRSRLTVLGLRPPPARTAEEILEKNKKFDDLRNTVHDLDLRKNGKRILARAIDQVKIIQLNAETLKNVISKKVGVRRVADQIGSLLAGAWSLEFSEILDEQGAEDWIKACQIDLEKYINKVDSSDEVFILQVLMQYTITVDFGKGPAQRMTVGQALETIKSEYRTSKEKCAIIADDLKQIGIRYTGLSELKQNFVYIAKNSWKLGQIFASTPAQRNWDVYLRRLDFAENLLAGPVNFGTALGTQRAVALADSFIGGNNQDGTSSM